MLQMGECNYCSVLAILPPNIASCFVQAMVIAVYTYVCVCINVYEYKRVRERKRE